MSQIGFFAIASALVGVSSISSAGDLFAIRDGGRLNLLDSSTGSRSLIGNTGVQLASSLDMGRDGMLYTHSRPNGVLSPASLYQIDPKNADSTFIAELSADIEFEGGLTIRDDGMAYLVGGRAIGSLFESAIFLIDLSTGAATELGVLDIGDINGLTLRSDGMLVAWSQFMPGPFTIDPGTMETRILFEGLGDIFNIDTTGGMDSAEGEQAYLLVGADNTLISLDMYSGEMSYMHEYSVGEQITGIALAVENCPADLTGEGDLNFLDVSAFLVAFGNQESAADFTDEGDFNFLDVSAFLNAFGSGCP